MPRANRSGPAGGNVPHVSGMAMYELVRALGIEADVMLGHSSGESAALCASGANPAANDSNLRLTWEGKAKVSAVSKPR